MIQSLLPEPDPESQFDDVILTNDVCIAFQAGARGVHWATLHIGPHTVEVGTVRSEADIDSVLTMTAGILLERQAWADDVWISPDRSERWVLIGQWLLNARMCRDPHHLHLGSAELARALFDRRRGV